MNNNCQYEASRDKCKHWCKEYRDYAKENSSKKMLQGNDRQPMKRDHGALKRK